MGIPGEGQTFERLSRRLHLTAAGERFRSYDSHVAVLFDEMEKDLRDWDSFGILRVGPALPLGRIASLRKIYVTLQGLTDVKHKSSPASLQKRTHTACGFEGKTALYSSLLLRKHEQEQAQPGFDRVVPVLTVSCFSFPAECEAGSVPPDRAYWSRWALKKAPLRSRHSTASGIMRP